MRSSFRGSASAAAFTERRRQIRRDTLKRAFKQYVDNALAQGNRGFPVGGAAQRLPKRNVAALRCHVFHVHAARDIEAHRAVALRSTAQCSGGMPENHHRRRRNPTLVSVNSMRAFNCSTGKRRFFRFDLVIRELISARDFRVFEVIERQLSSVRAFLCRLRAGFRKNDRCYRTRECVRRNSEIRSSRPLLRRRVSAARSDALKSGSSARTLAIRVPAIEPSRSVHVHAPSMKHQVAFDVLYSGQPLA